MKNSKKQKLTKKINFSQCPSLNSNKNVKHLYYLIKYFKALCKQKSDRFYGFVLSSY